MSNKYCTPYTYGRIDNVIQPFSLILLRKCRRHDFEIAVGPKVPYPVGQFFGRVWSSTAPPPLTNSKIKKFR